MSATTTTCTEIPTLGAAHADLLARLAAAGPEGVFMNHSLRELNALKFHRLAEYVGGGCWAAAAVLQRGAQLRTEALQAEQLRIAQAIRDRYSAAVPGSAAAEAGARWVWEEIAGALEAGRL